MMHRIIIQFEETGQIEERSKSHGRESLKS